MVNPEVLKLVRMYADRINRQYQPKAIVLYGSQARGCARADSDIDVAVLWPGYLDAGRKVEAHLWGLADDVDARIEPVLITRLDRSFAFIREICKHGIVISGSADLLNETAG